MKPSQARSREDEEANPLRSFKVELTEIENTCNNDCDRITEEV